MYIKFPEYSWPHMTPEERHALAETMDALHVHEEGHFLVLARIRAEFSSPFYVDSVDEAEAGYVERRRQFAAKLAAQEKAYDDATQHGVDQSDGPAKGFPGGKDVTFTCPR